MLSSSPGTRLIYEPANLVDQIFDGERASTVELPREGDRAMDSVLAALDGQLRNHWVDQLNVAHWVRRRVVKDVRAISLAGAVHRARPATPLVILVRHPIAVARSVTRLGWLDGESSRQRFEMEVRNWSERHCELFMDPRLADAHFVAYEDLCLQTVDEVSAILAYAGALAPTWRAVDISRVDPAKESATAFRGFGDSRGSEIVWGDLPVELIVLGTSIVAQSGLGALYDERTTCNTPITEFVERFRATSL